MRSTPKALARRRSLPAGVPAWRVLLINRGLARLRYPPSLSYGATRVYGAAGVDVDLDWPTPRLSFVPHIDAKPRLRGSP